MLSTEDDEGSSAMNSRTATETREVAHTMVHCCPPNEQVWLHAAQPTSNFFRKGNSEWQSPSSNLPSFLHSTAPLVDASGSELKQSHPMLLIYLTFLNINLSMCKNNEAVT